MSEKHFLKWQEEIQNKIKISKKYNMVRNVSIGNMVQIVEKRKMVRNVKKECQNFQKLKQKRLTNIWESLKFWIILTIVLLLVNTLKQLYSHIIPKKPDIELPTRKLT